MFFCDPVVLVVAVQKLLEARGITTFLDREKLIAGFAWPQALEEGLRAVRGVAVFIGRGFGGWQKREIAFALDRQVREEKEGRAFPVIPVLLQGAELASGFLFTNTWIDLRGGLDGAFAAKALDAFERAINSAQPAQPPEGAAVVCPYRGLRVFREEDAGFFFGRRAFADQLLHFTLGNDLVAVVGPSGSGKSSVVQAGLLPRLRRERPPANTWDAVSFTPGNDPFHRLASALIPLLDPDNDKVERLAKAEELGVKLADGRIRIESVIDRVIEESKGTGRLLLIADQFEELFTLAPEPGRRAFAQALVRALGRAPFTLLVTLRADFYSQIITVDRDLSDRLTPAQVNIGALTPQELRESITAPARLVGLEFEPGLVERILADVGSEPGHLPLVEFALTELWQHREGSLLANRAYDEIGGVTGALAQRAEAELTRLKPEQQIAARRLFSRLVRVARPEEAGEDTRQLADLTEADPVTKYVAKGLADARLLVTGGETKAGALTVEVAHEALIRNWLRLRVWLNEDREFLLWRQRLQVQAGEWHEHGQDAGYLLRGAPLSEAERWFIGRQNDLTDGERELIRESIALRERERQEEHQRRMSEVESARRLKEAAEAKAEAEQHRAAEQARRARGLRRSALALGAMLLLALASTGIALWQRGMARERELVSTSRALEDIDPELSVVAGAQALAAAAKTWGHAVLPEAEEQLHRAILASVVRLTLSGHSDEVRSVAWSPDGKRLVTASADETVKVWNSESGEELFTITGHRAKVYSVAWSPDGKRLATGSADNTAKVWDAETGKELRTISGHKRSVSSVAWSPDGKRLATGSLDNTAKVWDAETGKELLTLKGHSGSIISLAWSPDGERLATGSEDNTGKVWDAESGKESRTLSVLRGAVECVAWSPDGKRLAMGSAVLTASVLDVSSGNVLLTLSGHGNAVWSVGWSPDGKRLATGSADNTAKVWDAETGKELLTLNGHRDRVWSVSWSPEGKQLATGSRDKTAKVWEAEGGKELFALHSHGDRVFAVAWSPDGKRLATGSLDNTAKVWDAETGKELLTLNTDAFVNCVAWSPDGKRLATGGADQTVRVWDTEKGKQLLTLTGQGGSVDSVAWNPDGKRLLTANHDHTAKVWDVGTRAELLTLRGHSEVVWSAAWSPNGRRLATGSWDHTAKVWDAETGKELLTLRDHLEAIQGVAWSADGKRLATASEDNTGKVWDADSGKGLLTLRGHIGFVNCVAWSPDGRKLATGSADQTTRVWDAETGKELLTLGGHSDEVRSLAWSPDGKRLATASGGTVQVYAMNTRDLMALAHRRVTAHPSAQGCKKYLHVNECPPVPDLSFW
jgi:WD40 repeat protein